ncbi:MAG: DnaJ domain-containing protein [Candidatus Kentron sp. G]|nr:MAG: DnaJ domain-containing protein [Candidatus Kentron sp. G]VFM96412.1 MAG: DnaJ domain-containing protein [Candidatus Kentron sp. G]VFM98523.1 MAG: DnaJ domain-containing protein [Candidatus Kentron sp. G]
MHPALLAIVLVGLIVFFNRLRRLPKAERARFTDRMLPVIVTGMGLLFTARGLHPLLAVSGVLLLLLPRLIDMRQPVKSLQSLLAGFIPGLGGRQGQTSNSEGYERHAGRTHQRYGKRSDTGDMTIADAYKILGLSPDSSRKDIIATHRKLIQKVHPDRGGSTFLATQINQAKDLLMTHVRK